MEQLFESLSFLGKETALFIVSMLPIVELRGAVPLGALFGMEPLKTLIIAIIGNLLPIPFVILLARPIFNWLKNTKLLSGATHKFEAKLMKKADKVMKYSALGLTLFVAIPIPGTGAWTGAMIAALLDMRLRYALPAITVGVLAAGIIMAVVSFGASALVGFIM